MQVANSPAQRQRGSLLAAGMIECRGLMPAAQALQAKVLLEILLVALGCIAQLHSRVHQHQRRTWV